jgi:hypothetical protein
LAQYVGELDVATNTASTFSSHEIYVPNYASTTLTAKSYSVDSVTENNATTAYANLIAGLITTGASGISSITFTQSGAGNFVQHSTFSLYGVSALGTTPTKAPKATGGSIIQTDGTYWYHAFLSSGTFTPATALSCDYLVVAGGGGGGGGAPTGSGRGGGAGGGAGGLRSTVTATGGGGSLESALSLASGIGYTVTIGAGGAGGSGRDQKGFIGNNSVFSTITSTAGGGGGAPSGSTPAQRNGLDGGSGGGGAASAGSVGTVGAASPANQGFAGGLGSTDGTSYDTGGGGGGGGAVGAAATFSTSANGGVGVAISSFASVTATGVSNY